MNSRVALFSQYLMRDDAPREEGYRFRGFESGLRRNDGRAKPAYRAFAEPAGGRALRRDRRAVGADPAAERASRR